MVAQNKRFTTALSRSLRRFFAPPLQAVSRTGKLVQTLWDAAQLQEQNRDYKRRLGEIAMRLIEEGQLKHTGLEKIVARLKRNEHLLSRLETVLSNEVRRPGSAQDADSSLHAIDTDDELFSTTAATVENSPSGTKDSRLADV